MGYYPTPDWLPEWSKGSDSSSDVFVRVGSNPTPVIFYFHFYNLTTSHFGIWAAYFSANTTIVYCTLHL